MSQAVVSPAARITIRRPMSSVGFIDAAWWPQSRDLAAELPALLDALADVSSRVTRVTYMLAAWDIAPRRVVIGRRIVRLGGYTVGDANTISLWSSSGRHRIDVLVVLADTDPDLAEKMLEIAGRSGSLLRAGEILTEATSEQSPA